MANIAKLAVQIVANATGVKAGLDGASRLFSGFASRTKGALGGALGGGLITTILGGPISAITSIVGGAVTSQIGGLGDKFTELSEKIRESARNARNVGISTEEWQGLEAAAAGAGIGAEQFAKGMMHLRKESAGDTMTNLKEIAEQVANSGDQFGNAVMLSEKFSKSGVRWQEMFKGGAAGLDAAVQKARDLGYALSDVDAAKVEAAKASLGGIGRTFQGIYTKIIVAMAPAISFVAGQLMKMAPIVIKLASMVGEWIDKYWRVMAGVVEIIITQVGELWSAFTQGAGLAGDWFENWPSWGQVVKGVLYGMAVGFAYVWDTIKAGGGFVAIGIGAVVKVVSDLLKTLPDKVRPKWADDLDDVVNSAMATGKTMVSTFGDTHDAIDKMFDKIWAKQEAKAKQFSQDVISNYQAAGAAMFGSKEARSIEAKFLTLGQANAGRDTPQVAEQKKTTEEVKRVKEQMVRVAERAAQIDKNFAEVKDWLKQVGVM